MKPTTALLIIDAQYDFCDPKGALYVPGAVEDTERIALLIKNKGAKIDHIVVTLDTHQIIDISHPKFWVNAQGEHPSPFTFILHQDVQDQTWIPLSNLEKVKEYLFKLEAQNEFKHIIWPEHCLIGQIGSTLIPVINDALTQWVTQTNKNYQVATKGLYPLTEHFGIFGTQVIDTNIPETHINTTLLNTLDQYDQVLICGEARSHCVATSLKQILQYAPTLAKKCIVLTDCMSDVTGFSDLPTSIFQQAGEMGVQFITSTEFNA